MALHALRRPSATRLRRHCSYSRGPRYDRTRKQAEAWQSAVKLRQQLLTGFSDPEFQAPAGCRALAHLRSGGAWSSSLKEALRPVLLAPGEPEEAASPVPGAQDQGPLRQHVLFRGGAWREGDFLAAPCREKQTGPSGPSPSGAHGACGKKKAKGEGGRWMRWAVGRI